MKEDEMGGTRSIYWWDKTYVQDFGWNAWMEKTIWKTKV
jgi:hypothetical protein